MNLDIQSQDQTITLTIPAKLLERFNRTRAFDAWNRECPDSEIPALQERLMIELESYCTCVEEDMIHDGEGKFTGDRLENEAKGNSNIIEIDFAAV